MSVERIAIAAAVTFFQNRDYEVHLVSHSRQSTHAGCDLVIVKGKSSETIEVKGTSNEWKIPDLYHTEVRDGKLTADYLLLVYIRNEQAATFLMIPRDAIQPHEFQERRGYRVAEAVKQKARLEEYLQELKPLTPPATTAPHPPQNR